jgi:REP element-mobilizing transposase RayT
MANTYTSLHYHVVFSTKNREPWIVQDIEQRVWSYIGGIARAHKITALQVGGVEDHIHALVTAPATIAPAQIAQYLKGDSSKWIHDEFRNMRASLGRMDMACSLSANRTFLRSCATFRISVSITERGHSRKSILNSCRSTVLNTTNDISGADSGFSRG